MSLLFLTLLLAAIPEDALSIKIEPLQKEGVATIEFHTPFNVVITNNSEKPIRLWYHDTKSGYRDLSLVFTNVRTGEKHVVLKKELPGDQYWEHRRWGDRRKTDIETIAPHSAMTIPVELDGYTYVDYKWKGLPSPNIPDHYLLSVQFQSNPSPEAARESIWTGTLKSKEVEIAFVAPELKTVFDYLRHDFAARAIEMMKADRSLINQAETDSDDPRKSSEKKPIHVAAEAPSVEAVRWLLENGADVNSLGDYHLTPLHSAASAEVVELLLKKKADTTIRCRVNDQFTALQQAAYRWATTRSDEEKPKYRKIVDAYLNAGIEPDLISAVYLDDLDRVKAILLKSLKWADNYQNKSPLRIAASLGYTDICKYLLENYKVDVNDFKRGQGHPIIRQALAYPKVVQLLLDHHADLKTRISFRGVGKEHMVIGSDATALHFAASEGTPETVTMLIDAGVDIFAKGRERRSPTALEVAAIYGRADTAQAILQHPKFKMDNAKARQALLDRCLVFAVSPLWYSRHPQRFKLVQLLIAQGASPKAKYDNQSALQVAAAALVHEHDETEADLLNIIPLLRKLGADYSLFDAVGSHDRDAVEGLLRLEPQTVSTPRSDGDTPLHLAIRRNNHEIMKLLLAANANVNAANNLKATPLHEACRRNEVGLAKLLLQKGANPDARDKDNKTPLDLVKADGYYDSAEMVKLFEKYQKK